MTTQPTSSAHPPIAFVAAVVAHVAVTIIFVVGIAFAWEGRLLLAYGIGVVATAGWVAYARALSDEF
jgi:hypothetical protein